MLTAGTPPTSKPFAGDDGLFTNYSLTMALRPRDRARKKERGQVLLSGVHGGPRSCAGVAVRRLPSSCLSQAPDNLAQSKFALDFGETRDAFDAAAAHGRRPAQAGEAGKLLGRQAVGASGRKLGDEEAQGAATVHAGRVMSAPFGSLRLRAKCSFFPGVTVSMHRVMLMAYRDTGQDQLLSVDACEMAARHLVRAMFRPELLRAASGTVLKYYAPCLQQPVQ